MTLHEIEQQREATEVTARAEGELGRILFEQLNDCVGCGSMHKFLFPINAQFFCRTCIGRAMSRYTTGPAVAERELVVKYEGRLTGTIARMKLELQKCNKAIERRNHRLRLARKQLERMPGGMRRAFIKGRKRGEVSEADAQTELRKRALLILEEALIGWADRETP